MQAFRYIHFTRFVLLTFTVVLLFVLQMSDQKLSGISYLSFRLLIVIIYLELNDFPMSTILLADDTHLVKLI